LSKSLADALFTKTQQRVLGALFSQPGRSLYASELIRTTGTGSGAAQRELARLETSGLVVSRRVGHQKHYQANPDSPIFSELHGLVVKTVGLVEPLSAALAGLEKKIALAFVFGSVASGTERAGSDIDLLVVSDELSYPDLYEALQSAEEMLARSIHPTVMTRADWNSQQSGRDSFVRRVAGKARLFVIGSANAIA